MLFNSFVFIGAFLPLCLLVYYATGKAAGFGPVQKAILVLFSLFFYGFWKPIYLGLLFASLVVNYGAFKWMRAAPDRGRTIMVLGIAFNLCLLGYFKYAGFFAESLSLLPGLEFPALNIALPLAISFFTFQQIAFLVDARKDQTFDYSIIDYSFFVTFFPQLIAGPIVHHKEIIPQYASLAERSNILRNLHIGLAVFTLGLAKKVLLADSFAQYATPVFAAADGGASIGFQDAWTGALAYTLQLYFDFSGYSEMAIGLAAMFGLKLPVNFSMPYKARNISDFWRRWHITLSEFLRDYLYIPLGGNRKGRARRYLNLFITMLLGGLWHGAGWTFVFWGGLHGAYLALNQATNDFAPRLAEAVRRAPLLPYVLTFGAVVYAWVFFRAETFGGALAIVAAMSDVPSYAEPAAIAPAIRSGLAADLPGGAVLHLAIGLAIVFFAPSTLEIAADNDTALKRGAVYQPPAGPRFALARAVLANPVVIAALFILSLYQVLLAGAGEFLYFNF
ncbi:MAG: MBOAT family O-acyltransferase [Pseudomonadota bacterium]